MGTASLVFLLVPFVLLHESATASRIKIAENGYEDILIALPAKTPVQDRTRLISSLKSLLQESSLLLQKGTKGRAHFQSVVILVPPSWGDIKSWLPKGENASSFDEAGSAFRRDDADVQVTHATQPHDHPYTLHQGGCGRTALRINMPSSYVLSNPQKDRSEVFIKLWSEFRYGIFIEDGFDGDKMFPQIYNIPGDPENRTTGCNLDFFRSNHWRNVGNAHRPQHGIHYTPKNDLFCEGQLTLGRNHNPEAPSKHNLLCNEQGTWYVVHRNEDFKNGRNAAKHQSSPEVMFRFVREVLAPKVVIAIEISSQMRHKHVSNENSSFSSAPDIVIVTTQNEIDAAMTQELRKSLEQSEIRLHVLSFVDDHPEGSFQTTSLYQLCLQTRNRFVSLKDDVLEDLYRALSDVVTGTKSKVLVTQEYLPTQDEESIRLTFTLDSSLTDSLEVSLSGPTFKFPPLTYDSTTLTSPTGYMIHPRKQELVPSWIFKVKNVEVGEYVLETKRKEDQKSPVLLTVTGSAQENPITADVWAEILESEVTTSPVQIFAEIKQGQNPIRNATVVAFIQHPGTDGVTEILLLDGGLGSVDITRDDGIYSSIYTNFTSTGFYNVYIEVSGDSDSTEILKGPTSACCGSTFSYRNPSPTGQFQRAAGPATFQVKSLPNEDLYPPSKVMDLRIFQMYDKVVVLHWTAVGDDFNTGVATSYVLKLFPDRFTLRNKFSDSGLDVFSEQIDTTLHATYGTQLYHMLQLPKVVQQGVYYFAICAIDEAGNVGEPSNAVPVWIEQKPKEIHCSDDDE